jgi:hypothetical protein
MPSSSRAASSAKPSSRTCAEGSLRSPVWRDGWVEVCTSFQVERLEGCTLNVAPAVDVGTFCVIQTPTVQLKARRVIRSERHRRTLCGAAFCVWGMQYASAHRKPRTPDAYQTQEVSSCSQHRGCSCCIQALLTTRRHDHVLYNRPTQRSTGAVEPEFRYREPDPTVGWF